jgi:predicted DNA-binding protein (MmcQ/YjbR family)
MVSITDARKYCIQLPEAEEHPHFVKAAFKVKKKIFAALDEQNSTLVVKFTPEEQYAFSAFDNTIIHSVGGAWGKQGWTMIDLKCVPKETFRDAVLASYRNVAPKKLAASV